MDDNVPAPRRAWVKPEVTRVDLVEDEVALASCKASFTRKHSTPNAGNNRCNATCKTVSST